MLKILEEPNENINFILINNNIDYSYHSDGYLIKRKDFLEKKSLFNFIEILFFCQQKKCLSTFVDKKSIS